MIFEWHRGHDMWLGETDKNYNSLLVVVFDQGLPKGANLDSFVKATFSFETGEEVGVPSNKSKFMSNLCTKENSGFKWAEYPELPGMQEAFNFRGPPSGPFDNNNELVIYPEDGFFNTECFALENPIAIVIQLGKNLKALELNKNSQWNAEKFTNFTMEAEFLDRP